MISRGIAVVVAAFALTTTVCAEISTEERAAEKHLYGFLSGIKHIYIVNVFTNGTADKVVGSKSDLEDFVKLRVRNSFAGIDFKDLPRDEQGIPLYDKINADEYAHISISVWTVGADYPVAYHIEITINKFRGNSSGTSGYTNALLGYASAKAIRDDRIVKNAISDLVDSAAALVLRVQDKL